MAEPLFTLAILSDIQYADKDDGGFDGRVQRYREVPRKLRRAVDAILAERARLAGARDRADAPVKAPVNAARQSPGAGAARSSNGGGAAGAGAGGGEAPAGLVAALHLGDIVDGYETSDPDHQIKARHDLDLILGQLDRLPAAGVPLRHVLGNHCHAIPRRELLPRLGFPGGCGGGCGGAAPGCSAAGGASGSGAVADEPRDAGASRGYYSAPLAPGWRLVVLDTTDISLCGREQGSPEAAEAAAWLAAHPPAENPNAQPWNGGAGPAQMQWLRAQLAEAARQGDRVIAAAHHPLCPGSAPPEYLAWGHEEVRAALREPPGVVALVLAGHYHPGGRVTDGGLHYITCAGMLEAPPGSDALVFLDVRPGSLVLRGSGDAGAPLEIPLPPPPARG